MKRGLKFELYLLPLDHRPVFFSGVILPPDPDYVDQVHRSPPFFEQTAGRPAFPGSRRKAKDFPLSKRRLQISNSPWSESWSAVRPADSPLKCYDGGFPLVIERDRSVDLPPQSGRTSPRPRDGTPVGVDLRGYPWPSSFSVLQGKKDFNLDPPNDSSPCPPLDVPSPPTSIACSPLKTKVQPFHQKQRAGDQCWWS